MESVDPATGETVRTFETLDDGALDDRLGRAAEAFESWREVPITERQRLLAAAGDVLREKGREYAETMTREMGKPVAQAVSEVEKCAWVCDYYAERAAEFLADERVGTEPPADTYVAYEPLGPVLAVMPWNFPF